MGAHTRGRRRWMAAVTGRRRRKPDMQKVGIGGATLEAGT
jgi:hypothetical protein